MSLSVQVNGNYPKRQTRSPEWEETDIPGVLRHINGGNLIARVGKTWVSRSRDAFPRAEQAAQ